MFESLKTEKKLRTQGYQLKLCVLQLFSELNHPVNSRRIFRLTILLSCVTCNCCFEKNAVNIRNDLSAATHLLDNCYFMMLPLTMNIIFEYFTPSLSFIEKSERDFNQLVATVSICFGWRRIDVVLFKIGLIPRTRIIYFGTIDKFGIFGLKTRCEVCAANLVHGQILCVLDLFILVSELLDLVCWIIPNICNWKMFDNQKLVRLVNIVCLGNLMNQFLRTNFGIISNRL